MRVGVQVPPTDRAEPGAVGPAEDLVGQLEHERVARPGRQIELAVLEVGRPQLIGLGILRLVFPRADLDVDDGVLEAPIAGAVQPGPEAELEDEWSELQRASRTS